MPMEKMELAIIENCTKRKISFNRRTKGLVKKAEELSMLCGVDVCLIVISPFDDQPAVWPPVPNEMERLLSKYRSLPALDKDRYRLNQEGFAKQMVDKVQGQYKRLKNANRLKKASGFMYQCLAGKKLDKFSVNDLEDMSCVIEAKIDDIDRRIKFLLDRPFSEPTQGKRKEVIVSPKMPESEMPLPEPTQGKGKEVIVIPDMPDNEIPLPEPTPTQGKGKEVIVIPDTPENENYEMLLPETTGQDKGKEVMMRQQMQVLPFDLNRPNTEEDDPDCTAWWEAPFQFPSVFNNVDGAGPSCSHP